MSKMNMETIEKINVGIVGHIDHGKTTLLSKITGKFADTHSEELKRGITIKLGYADIILEKGSKKRYVSFVDCPGHEMLMATMLSGAALIDAAILLIAANEGIKPQTREHLVALQAKNVKNILIIQNKIDLVTKEDALKNYNEIQACIKGTIAENAPIIPVSAQQDIHIEKIKDYLLELPAPTRDVQKDPLFIIARSFDINRPGTPITNLKGGVIAGVLKQGTIKVGDTIEIKPGLPEKHANQITYQPLKTKITSIYLGTHPITQATPGGSIACETELDNTLTKTDTLIGNTAAHPTTLPETSTLLTLDYTLFSEVAGTRAHEKIEDLKLSENIMLSVNTTTTIGRITKIKDKKIQLSLKLPIVPIVGDSVGIARNVLNHWRLIGFGTIL